MARLYSNENFPFPVVESLRLLGHDVLTVLEAGNAGQKIPDEKLLEFAIQQNRAVLTINRKHFIRLHRAVPDHTGIIACTYDVEYGRQAQRIHEAIEAAGDLAQQLLRVNRPSV